MCDEISTQSKLRFFARHTTTRKYGVYRADHCLQQRTMSVSDQSAHEVCDRVFVKEICERNGIRDRRPDMDGVVGKEDYGVRNIVK
jgi:hypothetical protein